MQITNIVPWTLNGFVLELFVWDNLPYISKYDKTCRWICYYLRCYVQNIFPPISETWLSVRNFLGDEVSVPTIFNRPIKFLEWRYQCNTNINKLHTMCENRYTVIWRGNLTESYNFRFSEDFESENDLSIWVKNALFHWARTLGLFASPIRSWLVSGYRARLLALISNTGSACASAQSDQRFCCSLLG